MEKWREGKKNKYRISRNPKERKAKFNIIVSAWIRMALKVPFNIHLTLSLPLYDSECFVIYMLSYFFSLLLYINTASPQIMSFPLMLSYNNIGEKKKRTDSPAGPLSVKFVCSPHVCLGFLQVLRFPPTSWSVHVGWMGMSKLSQSERVWVCVTGPVIKGHALHPGLPPCTLHCQIDSTHTTLNWNRQVGKSLSDLLLLIFLKWICISHIYINV